MRFDVYRSGDGEDLVLDCQADALRDLHTRFVVPLLEPKNAPRPARRLNPTFEVEGRTVVMVTQFAGAIPSRELTTVVTSLIEHDMAINNALDLLIYGV